MLTNTLQSFSRLGKTEPLIAACATLLLMGCGPGRPSENSETTGRVNSRLVQSNLVHFADITQQSQLQFSYHNGQEANHCAILESLGGGLGTVDFDRDGWMDLCIPGGGKFTADKGIQGLPTGLFRNLGDCRFVEVGLQSGMQSAPYYTHGAAVADYDNDGFSDILVTGYGGVVLWRNLGDGTFADATRQAQIRAHSWSSSAGWGDLNGDGCLDLYVTNYVNWSFQNDPFCSVSPTQREICSPKSFEPLPHEVYFANSDGTFRDATAEAGLRKDGKGLGVVLADLDADGDIDIYVANDTTPNFLYLNDDQGRLEEVGLLRGVALDDQGIANGSMGVDVFDFNNDGRSDIWVANYEDETFALYRNEGKGFFLHVSQTTGVTALGQLFVGFGTVCADFDQDGDEDIVVSNGHVIKYSRGAPRRQVPLYLENHNNRFRRIEFPPDSYFSHDHEGRGLAAADFDNDGDLDLAVSNLNDPVAVLRNECPSKNWVGVHLIGVLSNRDAIGARLTLHTDKGKIIRQIKGGGSYLSTNDKRVFWGVAAGTRAEKLTIEWPSSRRQEFDSPKLGHMVVVVESFSDEASGELIQGGDLN